MVVRLADGEHRPILELRPESRHRLRQVGGGHDGAHAGDGEGGARVDAVDPRAGAVDRHELDVEHVIEMEVGDVGLASGHPIEPADPGRRRADAVVRSSVVPWRRCVRPWPLAARRGGRDQDRLDDLLVAGAAAEVAGEALLDLGARRVRVSAQERTRGDELARDAEAALDGAGLEEGRLERDGAVAVRPGPRRS